MSEKILLDTDIGTNIDDALCLAYLLANPQCELLGITTVSGEAKQRAMIASALCKAAGRQIPIFPGSEQPLLIAPNQLQAQQAVALKNWDHDTHFLGGQAVEFLRQTIRAYPGEIILLTIGPLTNIGLLFSVDAEIPTLLKGLVMMCGRFTDRVQDEYGLLERNASGDPHATAIVYRANVKHHRSVGLDVTTRVSMSTAEFRRQFQFDLFQPVLDFAEIWFQKRGSITFHDPLAAATIFDEQICAFAKGTVTVEWQNEKKLGTLTWQPDDVDGQHEVALKVNTQRFFRHYFSIFH